MSNDPPQNPARAVTIKIVVRKPFDEDSEGDCILRTSDKVDFYVHKAVLKIASPVFADMFSMPVEQTPIALPVIDVAEDSETINSLLRSIYPVRRPVIQTLDLAFKLAQASEKYFIKSRLLPLQSFLAAHDIIKAAPLKVYALAFRLGYEEVAAKASAYTHQLDLGLNSIKGQLIDHSGGYEALVALYEMRLKRETILQRVLSMVPLSLIVCTTCRADPRRMKCRQEELSKSVRLKVDSSGFKPSKPEDFFGINSALGKGCGACFELLRMGQGRNEAAKLSDVLAAELKLFPRGITWPAGRRGMFPDDDVE